MIQGYLERTMNKGRHIKKGVLVLLLSILVWTATFAAPEAGNVPRRLFEAKGTMSYVDLPGAVVVIDGVQYQLAPNVKWYGLDPEKSLISQLIRAVDRWVGYVVSSEGTPSVITAVWVISEGGQLQ